MLIEILPLMRMVFQEWKNLIYLPLFSQLLQLMGIEPFPPTVLNRMLPCCWNPQAWSLVKTNLNGKLIFSKISMVFFTAVTMPVSAMLRFYPSE